MVKRTCSMCKLEKDHSEFNKMKAGHLGLQRYCRPCQAINYRRYRSDNLKDLQEKDRARYSENKESISEARKIKYHAGYGAIVRARSSKWASENKDKVSARMKDWRDRNAEKISIIRKEDRRINAAKISEYDKEYRKANRPKIRQINAKRRAAKSRATVSWASKEKMEAMYAQAQAMTEKTGVLHHVDHIVPLISDIVCGLHCEANMQVITAFENISKLNRRWPDMPED